MENKSIDINPNVILVAGGLAVGYFGIVKPVLEKLGIIDDQNTKDNKAAEIQEDAWKPTFWQQAPAGSLILTDAAVNIFIANISDAFGILWDNYDTVFGVFAQMKTKSQVSYLADKFQQKTGKGLYQFIAGGNGGLLPWDGLSSSHLATINKLVSSLPNYKA